MYCLANSSHRCERLLARATLVLIVFVCCPLSAMAQCPTAGYTKIRLCINLDALSNETTACKRVGQIVYPIVCLSCSPYVCTASDVLSDSLLTQQLIPSIMDVKSRIESFLCVNASAVQQSQTFGVCSTSATDNRTSAQCDHVVFFYSTPYNGSSIAFAQSCINAMDGRELVSTINLQPSSLNSIATELASDVNLVRSATRNIVLHFVLHGLGFNKGALSSWRNPQSRFVNGSSTAQLRTYLDSDRSAYPHGPIAVDRSFCSGVNDCTANLFTTPTNPVDYNFTVISATYRVKFVTPNLIATARSHFNCPSLDGVAIEEIGPSELHFERRVLNFEIMNTEFSTSDRPLLSDFTVAAFKDMGFFDVQTSFVSDAAEYTWGKGKGCAFLQSCTIESWGSLFCNGSYGVGYDERFASWCMSLNLPDVYRVGPYQHFVGQPQLGGWDPYADFCPYAGNVSRSLVARCFDPTPANRAVSALNSSISGPSTRTVWSTVLNQSLGSQSMNEFAPQCMQFVCVNETWLKVRVGDTFYSCDSLSTLELTYPPSADIKGTQLPFDAAAAITSYDYYGRIKCPNVTAKCGTRSSNALYIDPTFKSSLWPQLVNITPPFGSVLGGTTVTITYTWTSGISKLNFSCLGVAIGGQPTNITSYDPYPIAPTTGSPSNPELAYFFFAANTTYIDPATVLGGEQEDGSGQADVELLCGGHNTIQCGPQYNGLCGVSRLTKAFLLTPAPVASPPPTFLESGTGQALISGGGVLILLVLLIFAHLKYQAYQDAKKLAAGGNGSEGGGLSEKLVDLDGDGHNHEEVELLPVSEVSVTISKHDDEGNAPARAATSSTSTAAAASPPASPPAQASPRTDAPAPPPPTRTAAVPPPPPPPPATCVEVDDIDLDDDDDAPPPPPPPPPSGKGGGSQPPPPPPPPPPARAKKGSVAKRRSNTLASSKGGKSNGSDPPPPPPPPPPEEAEITL